MYISSTNPDIDYIQYYEQKLKRFSTSWGNSFSKLKIETESRTLTMTAVLSTLTLE